MPEEVTWTLSSGGVPAPELSKKLPYVGPWKSFSKLSEEEKEKTFNSIRGHLITTDQMENK